MPAIVTALVIISISGCTTRFSEVHFYRVDPESGARPNYYRLTISGRASFSKAKYISGCYDERAVQIVFDEIGTDPQVEVVSFLSGGSTDFADARVTTVGDEDRACPVGKSKLMIFSTDAKVVADTIGAFAESQVVAESMIGLLESDKLQDLDRRQDALRLRSAAQAAVKREVAALVAAFPAGDDPDADQSRQAALRLLNAIGRAQGRTAAFSGMNEARLWFELREGAEVEP